MKNLLYLLLLVPLRISEAHAASCDGVIPGFGCQTQVRPSGNATTGNDQLNGTLNLFWDKLITITYLAMGIIAVIMLVTAGMQYIAAAGNPEGAKKAKQQIINVMLGIILLTTSYYVINLILSAVNTVGK